MPKTLGQLATEVLQKKYEKPNNGIPITDLSADDVDEVIDDIVAVQPTQPTEPNTKIWIDDDASDSVQIPTASEMQSALAEKVSDVQVNGISVKSNGVANIPVGNGLTISSGTIGISPANSTLIKNASTANRPIVPNVQHEATFYGLAKAAGDTTQSTSSNVVGSYTETAKSKISNMLSAPVSVSGTTPTIAALNGVQYICGEVSTLDITLPDSGVVDVMFTSGSTPTVLTVTPPTGVTVRWANRFDPTNLDANTTYEINICNGLGVAGSWT